MNYYPNMLIIRGTGRNVGKTLSACNIIKHLAGKHKPVGIKVSPHFHGLDGNHTVIHKSDELVIVEEKDVSDKDSSRMLQAGASKVFYVQAKNSRLLDVINLLSGKLSTTEPVVVESGGLYDYVEPSLLVTVTGEGSGKDISTRSDSNTVSVLSGNVKDFRWDSIEFEKGKLTLHA